jgi:hypothetical protein
MDEVGVICVICVIGGMYGWVSAGTDIGMLLVVRESRIWHVCLDRLRIAHVVAEERHASSLWKLPIPVQIQWADFVWVWV